MVRPFLFGGFMKKRLFTGTFYSYGDCILELERMVTLNNVHSHAIVTCGDDCFSLSIVYSEHGEI